MRAAVISNEFRGSVLPVVSPPFASPGEAEAALQDIRRTLGGRERDVIVQPGEGEISPMSEKAALQLLRDDPAWARFLEDFGTAESETHLRAKEFSRCWIVLAVVRGAQIPPGEAFIVDKYSGCVFSRRYVDAVSLEREHG